MKNKKTEIQQIEIKSMDILNLKTKKSMQTFWCEMLNELINVNTKYTNTSGISPFTIKKSVSNIRKNIESNLTSSKRDIKVKYWLLQETKTSLDGKNDVKLGIVTSGLEVSKLRNEKSKQSFDFQSTNVKIFDFKGLIKKAEKMAMYNDISAAFLGLAILTGRRSIEIAKTGNFKAVRGQKNYIEFTGQAKSKTDKTLIIPVLADSKFIIKAVAKLRKNLLNQKDIDATTENTKVNGKIAKPLERAVTKSLQNRCNQSLKFHDLRKVYVKYCLDNIKPVNLTDIVFVQSICGHDMTDTGKYYRNFELTY